MRYSPSDKTEIIRLVEQSPWRLDERWKSSAFRDPLSTAGMIAISGRGVSGISCAGGHNGNEGDLPWPDAKSLR